MISRRKKPKAENNKKDEFKIKYPKPKILLIDFPKVCYTKLEEAEYNASFGTFGSPYKLPKTDEYTPLIGTPNLPNCSEQEIIFIDLRQPELLAVPDGVKETSDGQYDFWVSCSSGVIDPRPKFMSLFIKDFDRIFEHGGFFVVFAEPRLLQDICLARMRFSGLDIERDMHIDNYSFLSFLSAENIQIETDSGKEVNLPINDNIVFSFFREYLNDFYYTATFLNRRSWELSLVPILFNKFDSCVGGLLFAKEYKGGILLLPQLKNKDDIIYRLLNDILPEISPHLFPYIEGGKWVERDEYELEKVIDLKKKKNDINKKAEEEIKSIDSKIQEERNNWSFIHGIITKTGDDLVEDVKSCLNLLELSDVRDLDKEIEKNNSNIPKQEDLQVHDKSPVLLIEVKGISGLPRESDTFQIVKYIPRRMKEWDRTDVHGLSIINHQRNIPGLERENENVFTSQQVEDAKNNDFTILTTWDLFLLIKGMMKWGWKPEYITDLFYESGRLDRVPKNYLAIGKILNYWGKPSAIGVEINAENLQNGERIGYILPERYIEEDVESLQLEGENVAEVKSRQTAGIKTIYSKDVLRKGMKVYKVNK